MAGTFKLITLVGVSSTSYEEAIQTAIRDASSTVRNLAWFEVKELRGRIQGDRATEFQVKLDVGFKVEGP